MKPVQEMVPMTLLNQATRFAEGDVALPSNTQESVLLFQENIGQADQARQVPRGRAASW